jgi:uncharacterized damage-inducible protein DinB
VNSLELLRDLLRHMEWADATVWRAVLRSTPASADPVIKDRLHHTHMVQRAFLNVWRELPHTRTAGSDLSLIDLARWGREYHVLAPEFLDTLTENALDRPIVVPWAKFLTSQLGHDPAVPSLGETIVQVAAHSTYHRGQVNARLRELGEEPPLTDFIAWIWLGKPLPEWPSESK